MGQVTNARGRIAVWTLALAGAVVLYEPDTHAWSDAGRVNSRRARSQQFPALDGDQGEDQAPELAVPRSTS